LERDKYKKLILGPITKGVQIQTDKENKKSQKNKYFWMCLDVVLEKPL